MQSWVPASRSSWTSASCWRPGEETVLGWNHSGCLGTSLACSLCVLLGTSCVQFCWPLLVLQAACFLNHSLYHSALLNLICLRVQIWAVCSLHWFHFWWCTHSICLCKCVMILHSPYSICHSKYFPRPHKSLSTHYPHSSSASDLFTISTVLLFPECHGAGITQCVTFSDWLPSLSNWHVKFLCVFLWLDSSWFLVLCGLLLLECTTVYLFMYPLKDILAASEFWWYWINQPCADFQIDVPVP